MELLTERWKKLAGLKINEGETKEDLYYIEKFDKGGYIDINKPTVLTQDKMDQLGIEDDEERKTLFKDPNTIIFIPKGTKINPDKTLIKDPDTKKEKEIPTNLIPKESLKEIISYSEDFTFEEQNPLIKVLHGINTYDLESLIKDYLIQLYEKKGFGIATDKMVAIERALDQARDSFDKADSSY